MSHFTFLLVCVLVGLCQAVFGSGCGPAVPTIGCGPGSVAYGGEGYAEMELTGKFDVKGNTHVFGVIPVMGQVYFEGPVQAKGAGVTYGSCGCGCP